MDYTVVVVAEGNDAPGIAYITPYAATSIAEHFMGTGRDVLIVYDNLTKHAEAYRELSLLLRRPPGREAFPGDIFYIHSRLLERATPIARNLAAALPPAHHRHRGLWTFPLHSNQPDFHHRRQIYLSRLRRFNQVLPAVDAQVSVSCSRRRGAVGSRRAVAGDSNHYAQFEELETSSVCFSPAG